jgi:hypothetical protein
MPSKLASEALYPATANGSVRSTERRMHVAKALRGPAMMSTCLAWCPPCHDRVACAEVERGLAGLGESVMSLEARR